MEEIIKFTIYAVISGIAVLLMAILIKLITIFLLYIKSKLKIFKSIRRNKK